MAKSQQKSAGIFAKPDTKGTASALPFVLGLDAGQPGGQLDRRYGPPYIARSAAPLKMQQASISMRYTLSQDNNVSRQIGLTDFLAYQRARTSLRAESAGLHFLHQAYSLGLSRKRSCNSQRNRRIKSPCPARQNLTNRMANT
jgi:hypothetical protein